MRAAAVALWCALFGAVAQATPNVWTEQHTFHLSRSGARYALSEEVVVRVTVGTEQPERAGVFVVSMPFYAPLEGFTARIDGRAFPGDAIRTERAEFEDIFLSGVRYQVAELPTVPSPGSVIEYRYSRRFIDVAYAPVLYVEARGRLGGYEVRVEHPGDVAVGFELFEPRGPVGAVETHERAGRSGLTIGARDEAPSLPLFPYNGMHAAVRLRIDGAGGGITLSDADSFAAWYRGITRGLAGEGVPEVAALAASLQGETPAATVAALHDYVRGNVRYIADERAEGAFVPRAPAIVLDRHYGDCKDRAFLVAALARSLGLRVDVVLVSTRPAPEFDGPQVTLFDHAICAFTDADGSRTYFDPTHRYMPFGDLPTGDVSSVALRLGEDGAEPLRLPDPAAAPEFDLHVRAALAQPADGTATLTLRGSSLAAYRAAQARGSVTDVRNALAAVANAALYRIALDDFALVADSGRAATFTATADLSEFVVASPTRRYLPHTPFRGVPAEAAERAEDTLPIWTDDRPNARLALDLDAGGFTFEPAAVAHGAEGDPARFTAAAAMSEDGRVRLDYRLGQRGRHFAGADRDAYLAFARAYLGARRDMFVFRVATDN
ncbi:MAG TPA: transglutaminase domain-containing protein [Rhodothermales bacterium]|nr:transglutaminase domain-containing protein [Rhodothermales bacterium]